ncbi:MAG: hypothetical protein M1839_003956 [Geoglossum umbratile]|nr:MAG: hypothetical protein M1839_003956 [Geoglossum umbratile]
MRRLVFPEAGVPLRGAPDDEQASSLQGSRSAQVMQLELPKAMLDELVKSARGGKATANITIQFGRTPTLHCGNKSHIIATTSEKFRHELYATSTSNGGRGLSFTGIVTHTLEVRSPEKNVADLDDPATLELMSKMAEIENQKQAKTSIYVKDSSKLPPARKIRAHEVNKSSNRQLLNKGRSSLFPNSMGRSTTTSPASRSPLLMPVTSAPTSIPTSHQLKTPKLEALRMPLIHLLAIGPNTLKYLSRKTGGSVEDCQLLLQKLGKEARSGRGNWVLTDRTYKELDVWNFRYPSDADRKSAIDNAISAFDRLRLGREDKQWQLLLPRKERGKGKVLSRLGAGRKAEPQGNKAQDPVEDSVSTSRAGTDGEEMARSTSQQPTKKRVSEREAMAKRLLSKNPPKKAKAPAKVTQKKITKPTKKEPSAVSSKIKSAKFVEDSDSDIEMEDAPAEKSSNASRPGIEKARTNGSVTLASKPPKAATKIKILPPKSSRVAAKTSNPPPQATSSTTTPRTSGDMPKFSKISGTTKPSPPSAKSSPLSSKTSPQSSKTSPQATPKPSPQYPMKALPQAMGTSSRQSIKGNSPRKPSPLGASPPANASDFDSAPSIPSTASSPLSSQASKGQSTPTPGPIRKSIEKRSNGDRLPTPSTRPASHNRLAPQLGQPLKRKADEIDRHDPKKQSHPNQRPAESNKRRQVQATRPPPMSDSSVSPPSYTIEMAQRFKKIYRDYLRLHEELSLTDNPPADKVKEITSMHTRLSHMKMEISTTAVS